MNYNFEELILDRATLKTLKEATRHAISSKQSDWGGMQNPETGYSMNTQYKNKHIFTLSISVDSGVTFIF